MERDELRAVMQEVNGCIVKTSFKPRQSGVTSTHMTEKNSRYTSHCITILAQKCALLVVGSNVYDSGKVSF